MSTEELNTRFIKNFCFLLMIVLTVLTHFTDLVPLHLNITVFSLSIIIIGSYKSLECMVGEFKKVYIHGQKSENIESVSAKDAA